MRTFIVLAAASLLLFSSCRFVGGKHIGGDGNVITQSRSISGFSKIDVSSAIDVYVTQDSAFSVKVEVDNNLQQYIETFLEGNTLVITEADRTRLSPSQQIKVYVSAPAFTSFEASGACSIISKNKISTPGTLDIGLSGACHANMDITAEKIDIGMSGACSADLKGNAKELSLDGSGSSNLKAYDLQAENVNIDLSGAGDAQVYATAKLSVDASGAASVHYKGSASVNSDVSGAGSVKKVD